MTLDDIRDLTLQWPDVTEELPFGPDTLVLKNAGKIFLLISLDSAPLTISLKGVPEQNIELREQFPENVSGGYHLNKIHWNTIKINTTNSTPVIKKSIEESYMLVKKKTTKKKTR